MLYLSRFITRNKADYYQHLQDVRDTGNWENWVIYMLEAVAETSATTFEIVTGIRQQMADVNTCRRIWMSADKPLRSISTPWRSGALWKSTGLGRITTSSTSPW